MKKGTVEESQTTTDLVTVCEDRDWKWKCPLCVSHLIFLEVCFVSFSSQFSGSSIDQTTPSLKRSAFARSASAVHRNCSSDQGDETTDEDDNVASSDTVRRIALVASRPVFEVADLVGSEFVCVCVRV